MKTITKPGSFTTQIDHGGSMVGKNGKLWFRLGLLAALASICLSAYVIARAQSGPSWEVPVAVVEELRRFPIVAMLLASIALLLHLWSRRYGDVGVAARRGFLVVLLIAFAYPFVVWLFEPEQWPFQYVTLSSLAAMIVVPVLIACVVALWLIGFRWVKDA